MDSSFYSSQVVFALQGGVTLEKKSEPSSVFLLRMLLISCHKQNFWNILCAQLFE